MNYKRKLLSSALPLLTIFTTYAENGSNAYSFLEIPESAQAFALGGTNISSIGSDLSMIDQNPALLGQETEAQMGLSYMRYMGSSNFAGGKYGMGTGDRGAWAVGFRFLDYGTIQGYDEFGTATSEFRPLDLVIDGMYSYDFTDRLRGGITMKFIYSHYEQYEAVALATDLGLNYYNPDKDLSLSLVLKNMGGQLKRFNDHYDHLPFDIQVGYTQRLGESPFLLNLTATNLYKWKLPYYTHDTSSDVETQVLKSGFASNLLRHLIIGIKYSPADNDRFYIAAAYNHKTRTDMATYQRNFVSGFSAGIGFNVKAWGVSVAYAMPHKKGSSIMLNLALNIAEVLPQ
jgi:hypothetical protein